MLTFADVCTLQEGALHTVTPVKTTMELPAGTHFTCFTGTKIQNLTQLWPAGWVVGVIACLEQESGRSMSKARELDLMNAFFNSRKQERAQEQALLQSQLGTLRAGKLTYADVC